MGLTIHYELKSAARSLAEARDLVERLRQRALDLPFQKVGELVEATTPEDCDFEQRDRDDPLRWLLIQASESVEREHYHYRVPPKELIAFSTWPGEGCEEANFGLCRFPGSIKDRHGRSVRTGLRGWSWSSFCKTQYANNPKHGGVEHFLRCHLCVITMLDHAKELGMLGQVADEGGYWEHRDLPALAKQVGEWNSMIAGLAGRLKDAFGGQISAPIFDHPLFERLEAASQNPKETGT